MEEKDNAKNKAIRQFVGDNYPTEAGERELVIRTGAAEQILYPNAVRLEGTIHAPAEFYKKRKDLHDKNKCHVVYDKQLGNITLVVDEQHNSQNYEVEGSIIDNQDLAPFKINTGHFFDVKSLMQVLKFNRIHFVDKDDNAKIVLSLQNFKAKVEKNIEDANNNRGNSSKINITNLEHELQESFKLNIPIFKGMEKKLFQVDICVDVTDAGVRVWLESKDLKELKQAGFDSIIDEQLETFKEIVCIQQ